MGVKTRKQRAAEAAGSSSNNNNTSEDEDEAEDEHEEEEEEEKDGGGGEEEEEEAGKKGQRAKEMRRMKNHFLAKISDGSLPRPEELIDYARSKGMDAIRWKDVKEMRSFWRELAMLKMYGRNTNYNFGPAVFLIGCLFVDLCQASFTVNNATYNHGKKYILVAAEGLTTKLGLHPLAKKNSEAWRTAMHKFLTVDFPYTRVVVSDRDSAVSREFIKEMEDKYNVSWIHLPNRNKAFLAERMIRFVKRRLTAALLVRKGDTKRRRRWLDLLDSITDEYNNKRIKHTSFRRKDVDTSNQFEFLDQLLRTTDSSMRLNTAVINSIGGWPGPAADKLYRYRVGERVLLRRKTDYSEEKGAVEARLSKKFFLKPSEKGAFSEKVYTVRRRFLKGSRTGIALLPAYKLVGKPGSFYEDELSRLRDKESEATTRTTKKS